MKTLIIDRFEGTYAICEDDSQKFYAIETAELPQGAGEGDMLDIGDDGTLSLNREKTAARRGRIKKKQDSLWE